MAILPAGNVAVISTSPPVRNWKKRLACSFSWLAVSSNTAASCSRPSLRAALAK